MFKYKIVWGDTLSELANQFDTTVKKLAKDNNIKNIDLIYAGEDLDVEKKCNNYKEEKKEKK
ncbi:LysM domain-containing protein [Fusobacterium mortiferum]|nr:LysM domain-containing protein [Fusobacterium mortiferum]